MLEKSVVYHREHELVEFCDGKKFKTILADPPWQFQNRTGKVAPEHKRLNRYPTMSLEEIKRLPVQEVADENCRPLRAARGGFLRNLTGL